MSQDREKYGKDENATFAHKQKKKTHTELMIVAASVCLTVLQCSSTFIRLSCFLVMFRPSLSHFPMKFNKRLFNVFPKINVLFSYQDKHFVK